MFSLRYKNNFEVWCLGGSENGFKLRNGHSKNMLWRSKHISFIMRFGRLRMQKLNFMMCFRSSGRHTFNLAMCFWKPGMQHCNFIILYRFLKARAPDSLFYGVFSMARKATLQLCINSQGNISGRPLLETTDTTRDKIRTKTN